MPVIPAAVPALPLPSFEAATASLLIDSDFRDFFWILSDMAATGELAKRAHYAKRLARLGRMAPAGLQVKEPDLSAAVRPVAGLQVYPSLANCAR